MSRSKWLGTKWQLYEGTGFLTPLFQKLSKDANKNKNKNRFTLQVGARANGSKGPIVYYKAVFKKGEMKQRWEKLILVPRGNTPPQEKASLLPLTGSATVDELSNAAADVLVDFTAPSLAVERLECDIQLKHPVTGTKHFGPLCLYQFPKTIGKRGLLVVTFRADGNPGGSGAGGSN